MAFGYVNAAKPTIQYLHQTGPDNDAPSSGHRLRLQTTREHRGVDVTAGQNDANRFALGIESAGQESCQGGSSARFTTSFRVRAAKLTARMSASSLTASPPAPQD